MQDKEVRAWLTLHRTPHLSSQAFKRLIEHSADPEAIVDFSDQEFIACKVSPSARQAIRALPDQKQLDADCEVIAARNLKLLPISDRQYPELLKQIHDPPPLLYVSGNVDLLCAPQLAMVGSRRSSRQGAENAFRFARELAVKGFGITSGLAAGIDAASHNGALAAAGNTLAVLGTGVDVVYPSSNRDLFEQVFSSGVVISEFPLGTGPRRSSFPKRNRVISGLSLGVLVVEAALKSGSLISARCAMEQGREVFAVPGSIHNTGSKGCHALIKQGAKLVETTSDIMEELEGWLQQSAVGDPASDEKGSLSYPEDLPSLTSDEQRLLDLMGFDPAAVDLLQQRSGWMLPQLTSTLMALEIKGLIENVAGCYNRLG